MSSIADAYKQIREEQELDFDSNLENLTEGRLLRGASALVFATRSKTSGDKVVKHANSHCENNSGPPQNLHENRRL